MITLENLYPIALSTNLGTTVTPLLAAIVSESRSAIQLSIAHIIFNLSAIMLFFPIPITRKPPLYIARYFPLPLPLPHTISKLGSWTAKHKWIAILYIVIGFIVVPGFILGLSLIGIDFVIDAVLPVLFVIVALAIYFVLKQKSIYCNNQHPQEQQPLLQQPQQPI